MPEINEPKAEPEVAGVKEFAEPLADEVKTDAETVVAEVVEEVVKSCDTCRHYAPK